MFRRLRARLESSFSKSRLSNRRERSLQRQRRRLLMESLEQRSLMAVNVDVLAGSLVVTDGSGVANDAVTMSLSGANVRVHDPGQSVVAGAGATQVDPNTVDVPLASITGDIQVNLLVGNSKLTLDLDGGDFIPAAGLTYQADDFNDVLQVEGGPQGTVTYNYTDSDAGSFVMSNFGTVTYAGLTSLRNLGPSTDITFNPPGASGGIVLEDDGVLANGMTRIRPSSKTSPNAFVETDFLALFVNVTIQGNTGGENITLSSADSLFEPSLSVQGGGGSDTITLSASASLTLSGGTGSLVLAAENVTINGSASSNTATITADNVAIGGAAAVSAATSVTIQPQTVNRAIDLGTNTGGILALTNAELDRITTPTLNLGSTSSGPIAITAGITRLAATDVNIVAGANNDIEFQSAGGVTLNTAGGNASITTSGTGRILGGAASADVIANTLTLTTGPGDASGNAIGISAGSSLDLDVNTINVSSSGSVYLSEVNSANIGAGGISVGGTPRLLTLVSGTFVLGGANRISDNVRVAIDSATLKLNGFDETVATVEGGSGLGRVVNDSSTLATLTLQDNVSSYTSNVIFGGTTANENNLGLVKSGTAIALISGNNTFTGPVAINAGRWDMGHANSLGATSGTTTVNSGAQLQLNGNSTAEPLSLNGNGGVGTLGAVANNGALSVLSGPITLAGDTLIAGNGSIQFTGVITDGAGTFGLSKFGTGTLILSNNNTYDGPTVSDAGFGVGGALFVNGSTSSNNQVTVQGSGNKLGGTGTIGGSVLIDSGSRLAPGTSPETLATGSLTLSSGSFFDVEVGGTSPGDGVTGYDQVLVTGTVNLGGATLNLQQIGGFNVNSGVLQTFTIIDNDGTSDAVTGTFAGLAEGSPVTYLGGTLYVSYAGGDGNDVVLSSQPLVQGTALADDFTVTGNGTTFTVTRTNANGTVTATFVNPSPAQLIIQGAGADDLLSIDSTGLSTDPIPANGILYDGQTQDLTSRSPAGIGDILRWTGTSGQTATYLPSSTTNGSGTVTVAGIGSVTFAGLEPVDLTGFGTANVNFPNGNDNITLTNGTDAATATLAAVVVSGTSGGVGFEAVHLRSIGTVNIDTTTVEGVSDVVTVASANNAHGISNLSITTGTGTDQIDVNGAITTSNGVTLSSQQINLTGLITGTGAWSLNMNAGSGSIADLNGVGTLNVSAPGIVNAQAAGNIELDTSVNTLGSIQSTAGNVTLREASGALLFLVTATVGDISISSPSGGFSVDTVTAAAGTVTINAGTGAINDSGTLNLTANAANLTGGAGINLDTAVNTLTAASTNAAITIRETNGLAVNTVNSGTGTTTLTLTAGALTDSNGAGTLNLTAGLADLSAPGGIDLDTAISTLTASTTNSAITVRESNGVALNLIDAGTANVTITLTAGALTDNNGNTNNVIASQAALTGASGVGTLADFIETSVGNLEANGGTGGVFIANTGNLTVGGVAVGLTGISATGGNINLSTVGTLSLSENVAATGNAATVTLSATQNVSLPIGTLVQAGNASNYGTVTVNIDSDNSGGGQLDFAGDIDAASATFNGNGTADTFNITPDQDATATQRTPIQVQGFAPVASPGDVLNLTVTGLTSPALTVSGINSGAWSFGNAATVSYVSIESVNSTPALTSYDLILDMEPTLTSSDSSADMIDVRRNGTNLELRVDGTVVFNGDESGIRSLQVLGGNSTGGGNVPNDTLVITETASGLPQFAGTSAAPGSNVSGTFTSLTGYNNAGVPVKIHFDGRGGVNSLQYNLLTSHGVVYTPDNLDTAKSGNVGIASDGTFTTRQLGLSFENLSPLILTGAGGSLVIDASSAPSGDVTQLTVIGSGVDPVANLNAGSSTDGLAIVYPNPSSATFEPVLFSGFASTIIRSGAGADTIDLTSIDAADPDGAGPGEALTALSLDADSLTNSDNSGDTIIVRTLPATVTATLLGGQGNDAFNIYNDQGTGGTSDDSVDAILGQVVIASSANDEGGSDTVTVRDFADVTGDTVTITATTIDGIFDAGAGTDITLNNNVDNVSINTGSSNDTFNLNAGGVSNDIDSLTVSGNAGNDTFLIQSNSPAAAATQLNGNSGADLFQFSVGAFVLRGGIDGGSQNDLVDWSNYSTARTIALTGFGATDGYTLTDNSGASSVNGSPGSMTNIDAIRGSSGSDQLSQNFNVRTHWDLGGNVSGFGPFGVSSVNLANSLSDSGVLVADESDISLPLAVSPVGQPTGANPIVPSGGEQELAWSGFENLTGAVNASDWFDWRNGASQSGTVDGRLGPDTFDYRDYSASVTVDLTTGSAFNVFGGAAGGIVADATGASIEHLMGGSAADQLTGDIDVNTIRGNDAADTINARDGVDDVDAGAGTDLIQVSGTEAEFDVMLGGPGGVEDATDYDIVRNVGAGAVTLNGFNLVFDGFANSIDEYDGANFPVIGNGNANELHFGFATMTNTPGLNAGVGNDDVTTSHANVSEVAYDGDVGTDNVTLVLTPDQFGALTTAEIFIVQDYVASPTGKTLSLTAQDTKGNFTATNFETAQIAVYDDDIIVDITACFLAIISEDQIVEGTPGDDTLQGTNLTDLIFGEDGNDVIYGGNASDCIFGGANNDTLYGENLNDLLVGGSGNDTLYGGSDEDRLFGNSGVDLLFGEFGHDTLDGGLGDDQLDGGNDHDTLNGGPGVDTVQGGADPDRILIRGTEAHTDIIDGGAQYDTLEIIAGTGTATLQGFSLANTAVETVSNIENLVGNGQILQGDGNANLFDLTGIVGPTGIASIDGLGGNDTLTGSASSDVLNGGDGNDLISGGDGFDILSGGNDNDTISGGLHNDTMNGGAGVDVIAGGDGYDVIQVTGNEAETDTMDGGLNTDTIVALGASPITLNAFNSLTNSIEGWVGNGLAIQGNNNANTLNFQLVGSMTGVPFIDGGLGNDTITGTNGVDNLRGGVGDDVLFGLGGVDTLLGGADNDSLNGGDGIDHLYGEAGVDTITTGAGRDIVYFASDETLTDTITDFALYSDTINLAAYVPVLTYSSLTFSIGVGYREVILPNGKRIRLNGWNRNPTSSQFQF